MSTNSDATDDREENGENREHKKQEARTHLEALAETDLPYAEYAERVLQALDSEGASDRDE
jgi:hypothetical protein